MTAIVQASGWTRPLMYTFVARASVGPAPVKTD